jgi:serine/threonine protein kinase
LIHRDIKPANILWEADRDEVLLCDFDIAAVLGTVRSLAGTLSYLAPEASDGRVHPGLDVFSLALTLLHLLGGRGRSVRPFPEAAQNVPDALLEVIEGGIEPDPARRWSLPVFAARLRGALNQLLADSATLTFPPGQPPTDGAEPPRVELLLGRSRDGGRTFESLPVRPSREAPRYVTRDMRPRPPLDQAVVVTGDWVRIEARVDRPGYLAVLNIGPTGNLNLLFASKQPLEARRVYRLLEVDLSPPTGRERLLALWSTQPLPTSAKELLSLSDSPPAGTSVPTGSYVATRDMRRVQESLQQRPAETWCATVIDLDHQPAPENA